MKLPDQVEQKIGLEHLCKIIFISLRSVNCLINRISFFNLSTNLVLLT